MGNDFNKTEADFAYDRYTKMGGVAPEQDLPQESALISHEATSAAPVDLDEVDQGADPALANDPILAADIGLGVPEPSLSPRNERHGDPGVHPVVHPAGERDELLESDAVSAAEAAGLTGGAIDYADDGEILEGEEEEQPLEDIPDADELHPGTAIDPVSPPLDVMPGTDVLNGSTGEED